MMRRLVTALAIVAGLAFPAMAQTTGATTNMEILRQKIKGDKKLIVAENLKLTDAEGTTSGPCTTLPEGSAADQSAFERGDHGVC